MMERCMSVTVAIIAFRYSNPAVDAMLVNLDRLGFRCGLPMDVLIVLSESVSTVILFMCWRMEVVACLCSDAMESSFISGGPKDAKRDNFSILMEYACRVMVKCSLQTLIIIGFKCLM